MAEVDMPRFEPGEPIEIGTNAAPFRIASGRAELFLRTPRAQHFLASIGPGDPVFPTVPQGARFVLVAQEPVATAAIGDIEKAAKHWRLLAGGEESAGPDRPEAFNAQLADNLEREAERRDREERARLSRLAQADTAEAASESEGLAESIRAAAAALGEKGPSEAVADAALGFGDTVKLARRWGLSARRIELVPGWHNHDQGPLILRHGESGAIIVALWRRGGYRIGGGEMLDAASAENFGRQSYALAAPLPDRLIGFWPLLRFIIKGNGEELGTIALAAVSIAIIGAIVPLATGWILSDVAPAGDGALLFAIGIGLFFAAAISYLLSTLRGMATSRLQGKTSARLASGLFDRVLRLPAGFFRDYAAGDLNQRIAGVDGIRELVLSIAMSAGLSAVLSIFYFGVLAYYDVGLALAAALLVSVYVLIVAATRLLQVPLIREALAVDGALAEQGFEMVGAVAKLRTAAAEKRALARWARRYGEERLLEYRAGIITAYSAAARDSWQVLTQVVLFAAVAWLARSALEPAYFIAFLVAFGSFQGAFVTLSAQLIELQAAQPQIDRAKPILEAEPEIAASRKDPGALGGAIEVRDLVFGYDPGSPPVLSGVSLSIPAGAHAAIVGASGSGKSTLLRLLLGFEQPQSGMILYDGQDLAALDLGLVRAQAGVVLQSSSLFAGSIIENIRGSRDASLERCLEAAEEASLKADLESFPMGIHTPITEGAAVLSGGQRQRILIARALVGRPRLIFFDEATSALDNRSQAMVADTLDSMEATRITIAHRLSTIAGADMIYVLDQGRIAESGGFDELMAADGHFAALARRQTMEG